MRATERDGGGRAAVDLDMLIFLCLIFVLSGAAGLVYESIWTHYLKLFLGHAAYAQTLVLALFMGGMAIGSWLCSRWSAGWGNLLRGYAVAEGLIGIAALAFHPVFVAATDAAYESILPALGGEIPAMVLIDAVARLVPGVVGDPDSLAQDSFSEEPAGWPQFTRPAEYRGLTVPDVLLSGDHARIKQWRRRQAAERSSVHTKELKKT